MVLAENVTLNPRFAPSTAGSIIEGHEISGTRRGDALTYQMRPPPSSCRRSPDVDATSSGDAR